MRKQFLAKYFEELAERQEEPPVAPLEAPQVEPLVVPVQPVAVANAPVQPATAQPRGKKSIIAFLQRKEQEGFYRNPVGGLNISTVANSTLPKAEVRFRGHKGRAHEDMKNEAPIRGMTFEVSYANTKEKKEIAKSLHNISALPVFSNVDKIKIYEDGSNYSRTLFKRGENNSNQTPFRGINFKNAEYDEGEFSIKFKRLPSEEEIQMFASQFYREFIPVVPSNVENAIRAESMANDLMGRTGAEIEKYNLPTFSKSGSVEFKDLERPKKQDNTPLDIDVIMQELEKQEEAKPTTSAASNLNYNRKPFDLEGMLADMERHRQNALSKKPKVSTEMPNSNMPFKELESLLKEIADEQKKAEASKVSREAENPTILNLNRILEDINNHQEKARVRTAENEQASKKPKFEGKQQGGNSL